MIAVQDKVSLPDFVERYRGQPFSIGACHCRFYICPAGLVGLAERSEFSVKIGCAVDAANNVCQWNFDQPKIFLANRS